MGGMNGFSKLFGSIVTSTIWREDDKTRIVWITMLAITDAKGVVAASIPGLAAVSNVSLEDCERAIARLEAVDKYSRTKEHEGRRIVACDGGWQILNYLKYREKGRNVDRVEYFREKKREQRAACPPNVHKGPPDSTDSRGLDADAEESSKLLSEKRSYDDSEEGVMLRLKTLLGTFMSNDGGKWRNRYRKSHASRDKLVRVLEACESDQRDGKKPKVSWAAYAEDTWKRFAE